MISSVTHLKLDPKHPFYESFAECQILSYTPLKPEPSRYPATGSWDSTPAGFLAKPVAQSYCTTTSGEVFLPYKRQNYYDKYRKG